MTSSIGQYCVHVTDLERSVAFYDALGLAVTSRTEIPQASEAIVEHPGRQHGGRLQLAQPREPNGPLPLGNALWKRYVNTSDIAATHRAALDAGATEEQGPERLERWPVTVSFVRDVDGHLVELVERHPWPEGSPTDAPWIGQCCINVTDLDAGVAFYETLGLTCSSRTEIPTAFEAILESGAAAGGTLQLAEQKEQDGPIVMGALWKLYVNTDDCRGVHDAAVAAGHRSVMAPRRLDRWPTTIAFVEDPDGYQVELVQRHPDQRVGRRTEVRRATPCRPDRRPPEEP